MVEKNGRGNTIEFDFGRLVNNDWGAPAEENFTSSIFQDESGSFGWSWNRPNPVVKRGQSFAQPIYPSIRVGGNPWEPSKSPLFPFKWRDAEIFKFETIYAYLGIPDGAYNLAYDLFLTDSDHPGPDILRKAEVMIWLHGTQKQPPSSYKGDFSDGENNYTLYSRILSDGRLYAAFIMERPAPYQGHHNVDARRLMGNLALDGQWYIHGVELGNEIWKSQGKIKIDKISVNFNGRLS